jgi:hypothetical protein
MKRTTMVMATLNVLSQMEYLGPLWKQIQWEMEHITPMDLDAIVTVLAMTATASVEITVVLFVFQFSLRVPQWVVMQIVTIRTTGFSQLHQICAMVSTMTVKTTISLWSIFQRMNQMSTVMAMLNAPMMGLFGVVVPNQMVMETAQTTMRPQMVQPLKSATVFSMIVHIHRSLPLKVLWGIAIVHRLIVQLTTVKDRNVEILQALFVYQKMPMATTRRITVMSRHHLSPLLEVTILALKWNVTAPAVIVLWTAQVMA